MKVVEDAKQAVQGAASAVMAKAVQMAPDSWMPGGKPDPLIRAQHGHVGRPVSRVDGPVKVRGAAPYAAEFPLDGMLYASLVFSTIAKGQISALDTTAAEAAPGVARARDRPQEGRPQRREQQGGGPADGGLLAGRKGDEHVGASLPCGVPGGSNGGFSLNSEMGRLRYCFINRSGYTRIRRRMSGGESGALFQAFRGAEWRRRA